jgi:hypothetical protein
MYLFEVRGHARSDAGFRLRIAIREGNIARAQIRKLILDRTLGRNRVAELNGWRQSWILACERASQAITDLVIERDWPPESRADPSYRWEPPPRRQPASQA